MTRGRDTVRLISWDRPAEEIVNLGGGRLLIGSEAIQLLEATLGDRRISAPPGTLVRIADDALHIATPTRAIALRAFATLQGQPLTPGEVLARSGMAQGERLPQPDTSAVQELAELERQFERRRAHWVRRLAGLESVEIPYADHSRELTGVARYACADMEAPAAVAGRGAVLVVAALCGYLARLTGRHGFDVGFADPRLRRRTAEHAALLATHVPLRVGSDLAAVLDELDDLPERHTYPRDIVSRHAELAPLAQAGGVTHPVVVEISADPDSYQAPQGCELALVVARDGRRLRWVYDARVYSSWAIGEMQRQLGIFAEALAADEAAPFDALPLLSDGDLHRMLIEWNPHEAAYPRDRCVHQVIEEQADRTPDAPAVAYRREVLTYRELDSRANRLARYLRRRGAGPGSVVAIAMERSAGMVVAMLGILKSGAAYAALDPSYPRDRLELVVEDANPPVIVTEARLVDRLPIAGRPVVCLDDEAEAIASESDGRLATAVAPSDLCFMIYTSGSTGRPKGAMVTHQNTIGFFWSIDPFLAPERPGVWLAVSSIAFDLSINEILWSLARGFKVVVYAGLGRECSEPDLDESIAGLAERHGATHFLCTPSMAGMLLADERNRRALGGLERWLTGGEPMSAALAEGMLRCVPNGVLNVYGPTETSVMCTALPITEIGGYSVLPIGRPFMNTRMYVLDEKMRPVPVGVTGEAWIGGDCVSKGYLNRPELNAERFVPDPFCGVPGARMYRSGDMVRYRPDGVLETMGRADFQVKIRGHRIELGEVEARLAEHPTVGEVVAVAREDTPGDRRLVAYVTPKPGMSCAGAELRAGLQEKLPAYMVPSHVVVLERMPRTPNQKLDRKALPAPVEVQTVEAGPKRAPASAVQRKIAAMWSDLLGVRGIGRDDSFFDLGGHSLLAVRMFGQIEKAFGVELPLATLFRAPTVEALSALIDDAVARDGRVVEEGAPSTAEEWSPLVPIRATGSRRPLFFVHPSGGNVLLFSDLARRLGPEQPFYGLQAQGVDGKQPPLDRIEDMAALYVAAIRRQQPEGPYLIGGFSAGGVIAFEVAQQLRRAGQAVDLLAIVDIWSPIVRERQYGLREGLETWRQRGVRYVLNWPRRQIERQIDRLQRFRLARHLRRGRPVPLSLREPLLVDAYLAAVERYRPERYPGSAVLFRAVERLPKFEHTGRDFGWRELVGGTLEIRDIAGGHGTLMREPNVQVLAAQLRVVLDRANESGPSARRAA
jgi:amino acid adenylation domain-containing protein